MSETVSDPEKNVNPNRFSAGCHPTDVCGSNCDLGRPCWSAFFLPDTSLTELFRKTFTGRPWCLPNKRSISIWWIRTVRRFS